MMMDSISDAIGYSPNPIWRTSVKELCSMTPYPNACRDSLGSSHIIRSMTELYPSPVLYKISVEISTNEVSKALKEFVHENGTLAKNASIASISSLGTCIQLLSIALDNLNSSLPTTNSDASMSKEARDNFRTWLSASYADLQTCVDGFDDASHDVRRQVMGKLNNSTISVSNSLAIICKIEEHYVVQPGSSKKVSMKKNRADAAVLKQMNQLADVIVAQDGSGNFTSINAALNVVPYRSLNRFVIYVKKGVYKEIVHVDMDKWNVMMFGDGMNDTIVIGDLSTASGKGTFDTATFAVFGKGFIARDMGFVNAAKGRHRAVALLSTSDQSVFYRCRIESHQDTLYAHSARQFYRECNIYGTVDFIFGDSSVVIQNSSILPYRPIDGNMNTITAQGKSNPYSNTGISIQNCVVSPGQDLTGVLTYLGRPWRNYSTTIFMESQMESLIDPQGWLPWGGLVPDTINYVEFGNKGPGANVADRVKWKGVSAQNSTREEASMFTVRALINGDQWLPATGVPFQIDL
ncbi:pectinesterase-like [Primulina eburnea]|uniref:pectinesterase-like n=1 Tax=Primulina eburnea TaxID=1245227 RepID=UPI003C6BE93A